MYGYGFGSYVKRFGAWFLLLGLGVGWGLSFSLAKIAAGGGGHPLGIAYWQSLIAAAVMILVALARRCPLPLRRRHIVFYALCGILGTAIPNTVYYYAASRVSAGVLSITVATVPLMTFVAAVLFKIDKVVLKRVLGVLCGISAIVLLVQPEKGAAHPGAWIWTLAAVLGAVGYTAENMIIAIRQPGGLTAFHIAAGMFVAATVVMTPFMAVDGVFVKMAWPWGVVEWSIVGMAMVSVSAYGLFAHLIVRTGPVFASQTAYVVTLAGVFWGMAIFGERHSLWVWVALAVMLVGLGLVSPRKSGGSDSVPALDDR